jgi:hypothetical protein
MNLIDLTGKRFGRWTVIERAENINGYSSWLCRCDCGTERIMRGEYLRSESSKSCGCLRKEQAQEKYTKDLTGMRFGALIVIERSEERRNGRVSWVCRCDCGRERVIPAHTLTARVAEECTCDMVGVPEGVASFNRLYINYRWNAISRGLTFELNKEIFKELTKQNCYYCGKEPSQITKGKSNNGEYIYNGIDRIDSTKGYIEENVITCCKRCNYAKSNFSQEDFFDWIEIVYKKHLNG